MSNSVEVRLPFANAKLVEYILNIQGNIAYNPKNEKWLLKEAMKGILPEFITKRRKNRFPRWSRN
jgi:Asparagine synthase.